METWGIGVWQDYAAADLLIMFDELLEGGSTAAQAVERVWVDPLWGWGDGDDYVVQVLALAALALEQGVLAPELRDRALEIIESGAALQRWTDSVAELEGVTTARRQFVHQRLQARRPLLSVRAIVQRESGNTARHHYSHTRWSGYRRPSRPATRRQWAL